MYSTCCGVCVCVEEKTAVGQSARDGGAGRSDHPQQFLNSGSLLTSC